MGVDIRLHDAGRELVGEVEDEVVDSQLLGDATRVVDVAHRATTGIALAAPQSHRDADDLVPFAAQLCGGDRRIDATRHRDEHFHTVKAIHAEGYRRRRDTLRTIDSTAASTSSDVVVWPRLSRNAPLA